MLLRVAASSRPVALASRAVLGRATPILTTPHMARASVSLLPMRFQATSAAAATATASNHTHQHKSEVGAISATGNVFAPLDTFERRHNGSAPHEVNDMLSTLGLKTLEDLVDRTVPNNIRMNGGLKMDPSVTEVALLKQLKAIAQQNQIWRSYIGKGYYNTFTPNVILRNIMENPGWYTQYTPYQPEISQGRLESLLNFQTMVTDLTGLDIANASLLDEGTAAAEAMMMAYTHTKQTKHTFFVDKDCHAQTIACLKTRADPFNIKVVVGDFDKFDVNVDDLCGALVQYPSSSGLIRDYSVFAEKIHAKNGLLVVASDLLALTLLKTPGEFGADIALGSAQRFGVPLGYGGPHAAFFACKDEHKRRMPGRLIGVSKDAHGHVAMRLSLQTREQHIRREKATSNICTAQALLANMAAMYAVYHGPKGLRDIAQRVFTMTNVLREGIRSAGHTVNNGEVFDTLTIKTKGPASAVVSSAASKHINLHKVDDHTVSLSLDETVTEDDLKDLFEVFGVPKTVTPSSVAKQLKIDSLHSLNVSDTFRRTTPYLTHDVFNSYHSEHELLRYLYRIQSKDLSLTTSMIPLGSCTMKLNATTEMIPVTWPEFSNIHPFVPENQAKGYHTMFQQLQRDLCEITGFDAVSLQPNSGAMGEYTGLRVITEYLKNIGQSHRNVCLIPVSAHGTNPASAMMSGLEVVVVKSDERGNVDFADLKAKAEKHKDRLAAVMITYPSTFGVFELGVRDVCNLVHSLGGQVYLDGANMNAQVGLCRPGDYGADVCHLNLHKTFCIPHGGGGPGMGPIGVKSHLAPFLPSHPVVATGGTQGMGPVAAAPFSSASILTISYAYIKMMGGQGLRRATQMALLNANYMRKRLEGHYKVLFTNENGMCAHEFIIDVRDFKSRNGVEAIDIAKRLQDYGFHSPTMSWPVANTLMIEPTESESKHELDRFCDALISIRQEIAAIEKGEQPRDNNLLKNSPHTARVLASDDFKAPYTREQAAYPLPYLRASKFWPSVSRVNDTYGDLNLTCTCPPLEDYVK